MTSSEHFCVTNAFERSLEAAGARVTLYQAREKNGDTW